MYLMSQDNAVPLVHGQSIPPRSSSLVGFRLSRSAKLSGLNELLKDLVKSELSI